MEFSEKINGLVEEIQQLAGKKFNVASPKQLSEVLFVDLGLKHFKKTATGYSTNNEVLEKLRGSHPIVEKIIDYLFLCVLTISRRCLNMSKDTKLQNIDVCEDIFAIKKVIVCLIIKSSHNYPTITGKNFDVFPKIHLTTRKSPFT